LSFWALGVRRGGGGKKKKREETTRETKLNSLSRRGTSSETR